MSYEVSTTKKTYVRLNLPAGQDSEGKDIYLIKDYPVHNEITDENAYNLGMALALLTQSTNAVVSRVCKTVIS